MSLAFEEIFGIRNAFSGVPLAGRTDAWILRDGATAHGISPDSPALARFRDIYLRHLAIELDKPGPRKGVMPGVRELLDALAARDDIYLALLTGNYEGGARLKLEYFDLWRYFRCGAFGDEAPHRNGLVSKAVEAVAACGGPAFAAAQCGRDRRHAARCRRRGVLGSEIGGGCDRESQRRGVARDGGRRRPAGPR